MNEIYRVKWLDLGKLKILHPKEHSISNGYYGDRQKGQSGPWPCLKDMSCKPARLYSLWAVVFIAVIRIPLVDDLMFVVYNWIVATSSVTRGRGRGARIKGVGRKFSRGGGATKKRPKISKKYQKIALFSLFQGEPTKRKTEK